MPEHKRILRSDGLDLGDSRCSDPCSSPQTPSRWRQCAQSTPQTCAFWAIRTQSRRHLSTRLFFLLLKTYQVRIRCGQSTPSIISPVWTVNLDVSKYPQLQHTDQAPI